MAPKPREKSIQQPRKKYDFSQTADGSIDRPVLSERDERELARMVNKYGLSVVREAAAASKPRKRGRPTRGLLPFIESADYAQWIDEQAEEYRLSGHAAPVKQAVLDWFELSLSGARSFGTAKKKLQRGRKALQHIRASAHALNARKGDK